MMRTISTILLLLIASTAYAQKAVIVGPKEAPPGEMVILSSTGSTGDNLVWVKPEGLQTLNVGCSLLDSQIVFATTKPGRYEFWLIVADKEAKIDYAKHVVEIKGAGNPPPVDPDPVDPPPVDPSKWANLQTISKTNSEKVGDAATRSRLKAAIAAAIIDIDAKCQAGTCPTLDAAKQTVTQAIEQTILTRTGDSRLTNWVDWRKANQAEMTKLGLTDVKDYILAAKAIGSGL